MFVPMLEGLQRKLAEIQAANEAKATTETPLWLSTFELQAIGECIGKTIEAEKHEAELVQDMHDYELMISRAFLEREVRRFERGISHAQASR